MKYQQPVSLILIGILLLLLFATNDLAYYIHPNYFIFTAVMGGLLTLAGGLSVILSVRGITIMTPDRSTWSVVSFLIIVGVIIFGYLVPKKVLSPQTAENRGLATQQQNYFLTNEGNSATNTVSLLGKLDTTSYSITDWIALMSTNPEPSQYVGKKVQVKGFATNVTDSKFTISRFVIVCCAVDAVTVSLDSYQLVDTPVAKDEWIEIYGVFEIEEDQDERKVVIKPTLIERIDIPENPYYF